MVSVLAANEVSVVVPDLSRITVIIPALNEEQSLPLVMNDLPAVGEIVVVDNGSTDRTAAVASQLGAVVIEEKKRGYGAACLAGLRYVEDRVIPCFEPFFHK